MLARFKDETGSVMKVLALLVVAMVVSLGLLFVFGPLVGPDDSEADAMRVKMEDVGLTVTGYSGSLRTDVQVDESCRLTLLSEDLSKPVIFVRVEGLPSGLYWAIDSQLLEHLRKVCDLNFPPAVAAGGS